MTDHPRANRHERTTIVIRRVLAIIAEIRGGQFPNKDVLAEITGSNRRTVQRDLTMLKINFAAPIEFDRHHMGFYFSDSTWRLDK